MTHQTPVNSLITPEATLAPHPSSGTTRYGDRRSYSLVTRLLLWATRNNQGAIDAGIGAA